MIWPLSSLYVLTRTGQAWQHGFSVRVGRRSGSCCNPLNCRGLCKNWAMVNAGRLCFEIAGSAILRRGGGLQSQGSEPAARN